MQRGLGLINWFRARWAGTGSDALVLVVTFAAIALFVHLSAQVMPGALGYFETGTQGQDILLSNALVINVALILFGWRRYRNLSAELAAQRIAESEARDLIERDPLTNCLNRRSIDTHCESLINTTTDGATSLAFMMLDLDRFKQLNDNFGHAAGDTMLKVTSERISKLLPEGALLARLGGDEFAIISPFPSGQRAAAEDLAKHVIAAVAEPVAFEGLVLETTISVGICSLLPGEAIQLQTMLHRADIAMYHAKRTSKNAFAWFELSMEKEAKLRIAIETGIRRGIPAGEFVPYYEKQIDIDSGELTGFEMLARWDSPTLGKISPDVFIPITEEIGLISDLSESLIRQALRDALQWDPRLTLSVNISPLQMHDSWFAQQLLKLLVEANFPPSRLEVEVTESCILENITLVHSHITGLRNQGVKVNLDDFGTGYSSLSLLRSLPFDRIKIDRSFVMTLLSDKDSATIIQAIIALCEGLGLPITAEGIDSEEVLNELRRFGKIRGQGFLYGPPKSAEHTETELAELGLLLDRPAATSEIATERTTLRRGTA